MAASEPAAAPGLAIERRAAEKMLAPAAGMYTTTVITYAYLPRGDGQARLERDAARAFKELSEAHPRMRAHLTRDAQGHEELGAAIIAPALSDAAVARAVSVRAGDWRAIAEGIADAGFADMCVANTQLGGASADDTPLFRPRV